MRSLNRFEEWNENKIIFFRYLSSLLGYDDKITNGTELY